MRPQLTPSSILQEVHAIADDLTERLAKQGDKWLHASSSKPKYFEFTPIEFYALTERLKLPVPTAGVAFLRCYDYGR